MSPPPVLRPGRSKASRWRRFVRRYGWRAYALPLLAVITVAALMTSNSPKVRSAIGVGGHSNPARGTDQSPPNAASDGQLKVDDPGAASQAVLPALMLPPGPDYTHVGTGSFRIIPGRSAVIGKGGRPYKFSIEIENGVTGIPAGQFAAAVMSALSDRRSWTGTGQLTLQRVDSGPVDFHLSLASAMTVRNLCGYSEPVETSCYDGSQARVVLNVARWVRGAKAYASDLATYRIYAVNHEVGHALGHNHAHQCLAGGLAPVMMQQTIGDKTASGQICQSNPWPYPPGATDAPGAEQAGDGPDQDFFQRNSH
ncbi:MAG TPA: DUF3152 domain-containing protein [Jatrophihabitans sp.]|nr:DUF3152 domain-containing protein [Jatrophihabitans sp.]